MTGGAPGLSPFRFGYDGGVAPGLVRCDGGTVLLRAHDATRNPVWFGPSPGGVGTERYDQPRRVGAAPGTCYLAPSLEAVLLETVVRDELADLERGEPATLSMDMITTTSHGTPRALSRAVVTRPLVLVDLVVAVWSVHRYRVDELMAVPRVVPGLPTRYPQTQAVAADLAARYGPLSPGGSPADGILYVSRFAPAFPCVALWDHADAALRWGAAPSAMDADLPALMTALDALGIGLVP